MLMIPNIIVRGNEAVTKKVFAGLMAAVLCLSLCACGQEKPKQTDPTFAPTWDDDPILPGVTATQPSTVEYTPVYVTCFEGTAVLARMPVETWEDFEEPDCPAREISMGGRISCNGEHEREFPITRVIILESVVPRSTSGWFWNLIKLESIEGIEKLDVRNVTDMNHMFAGCEKLAKLEIDHWDVSKVTDMTAMFDDCVELEELPAWYRTETEES